jgi:phosphoglycolate phosphatase-like HAD superfamily hydrolase
MPALIQEAETAYARCRPDLRSKVCPGVHDTLQELRRRRIPVGLVTGNLTSIGWTKMRQAGLKRYFRFGIFAERARDRAGLVRLAIRHARREGWITRAARITLIGDHPNDIRAARANGVRAVAVGTGVVAMDELARHSPDVLVPDLCSLNVEMLL